MERLKECTQVGLGPANINTRVQKRYMSHADMLQGTERYHFCFYLGLKGASVFLQHAAGHVHERRLPEA